MKSVSSLATIDVVRSYEHLRSPGILLTDAYSSLRPMALCGLGYE